MDSEWLDKLDRLCGEKIMQWPVIDCGDYFVYDRNNGRSNAYLADTQWRPTRDISQAFELLERFKAGGVHKYQQPWNDKVVDTYYQARILLPDAKSQTDYVVEYAASASVAIVIACLKASGVEIPGEGS